MGTSSFLSLSSCYLVALLCGSLLFREAAGRCKVTDVEIKENTPNNTLIFNGTDYNATDLTKSSHPAELDCFIRFDGLLIYLTRTFDFENFKNCRNAVISATALQSAVILVMAKCNSERTSTSFVNFRLKNVNEFAPGFKTVPPVYNISVFENATVGSKYDPLKNEVEDQDHDTVFTFLLVPPTSAYFNKIGAASLSQIEIVKALDYEALSAPHVITLNMSVSDSTTSSPKTSYATINVFVKDSDDQSPKFTQNSYTLKVPENTVGTYSTTPPLSASDQDVAIMADIGYSIDAGATIGGTEYFKINQTSGEIIVAAKLDRENSALSSIILQVLAFQLDKPTLRTAKTLVFVTVEDQNDNVPAFATPLARSAQVMEGSRNGTFVTQVRATDADTGTFAEEYGISDDRNAFQIGSDGSVTVEKSSALDRETDPTVTATIWAVDKASRKLSSNNITLTVTLLDANDNNPQFNSTSYSFSVLDTAPANHEIGQLAAWDPDQGVNGEVTFSLLGNPGPFALSSSGKLTVNKALSTVTPIASSYRLTPLVKDKGTPSRSNIATVTIRVNNTNSRPPIFEQSSYSAEVPEGVAIGYRVIVVEATDPDSVTITYTIAGSEPDFNIDSKGVITTKAALDRETKAAYHLTVEASDGKANATATVNITVTDENDNNPVFTNSSYVFSIREELTAPVDVGNVSATDIDIGANANILYSVASADGAFTIDRNTGTIRTAKRLDREASPQVTFTVIATDAGRAPRSATAAVTVQLEDINDNAPTFQSAQYAASVPEGLPVSDVLRLQAADKDSDPSNTQTTFGIVSGDLGGKIMVNGSTGWLSVSALKLSDFGNVPQHQVTVSVNNTKALEGVTASTATATVNLTLIDRNDNVPVFTKSLYEFRMPENQVPGRIIDSVKAVDADFDGNLKTVSYWLLSGGGSENFRIDSSSGGLSLYNAVDRDPPGNQTSFSFKVAASDLKPNVNGTIVNSTADVTVIVTDVNDNAPKFSKVSYTATVNESAPNDTLVTDEIKATDIDVGANAALTYKLVTASVPFRMDSSSGQVFTTRAISLPTDPRSFVLAISVSDGGSPSLSGVASLTVSVTDINNQAPVFSPAAFNFSMRESDAVGTSVGQTTASDADGDTLSYSLTPASAPFAVDKKTGMISISKALDRESTPQYSLEVSASDGRFTSKANVSIFVLDANDNAPVFSPAGPLRATVAESAATGTMVISGNASDADLGANANLNYKLIGGSPVAEVGAMLTVVKGSGANYDWAIQVANGSLIDFDKYRSITAVVEAEDGGSPRLKASISVEISVTDINNRAPVFSPKNYTASVPENAPKDRLVTRVFASDPDTVGDLTFSLAAASSDFSVVKETATSARLLTLRPLDRETTPSFDVRLQVSDGTRIDTAFVAVTVTDVNDNAPRFPAGGIALSVPADATKGMSIGRLTATDADEGNNAAVTFIPSGEAGAFTVNYSSGEVFTARAGYSIAESPLNFTVSAVDRGTPALSSPPGVVTVTVVAANQHAPVFTPAAVTVSVSENTTVNSTVTQLNASDADTGVNGQVRFQLLPPTGPFAVDAVTGRLSVTGALDFETTTLYQLRVRASDAAPSPKTAEALVTVQVTDVDDNAPQFAISGPVFIVIGRTETIGRPLGRFPATDADGSAPNNVVTITAAPADEELAFNSSTGELTVAKSPLTLGNHTLTLSARSGGGLVSASNLQVVVSVVANVTEAGAPVFQPTAVYEARPNISVLPGIVVDVNATVKGGAVDDGVTYSFMGGDQVSAFSIDNSTGVVTLQKALSPPSGPLRLYISAVAKATSLSNLAVLIVTPAGANFFAPILVPPFEASIKENIAKNSSVLTVEATDRDPDANLIFSLVSDNSGGLFRLESAPRKVTVKTGASAVIDREAMSASLNGRFQLVLSVSDGKFSANATITIIVDDVNDNAPVFSPTAFNFTVLENANNPTVGQVTATDADSLDSGKLRFSLEGAPSNFAIDNTNGRITITGSVDRETTPSFSFKAVVNDSAGQTATADVTVTVLDANEAPELLLPANITAKEGVPNLQWPISASDRDLGSNGQLSLSITGGDTGSFFRIQKQNDSSFSLVLTKPLDREATGIGRSADGALGLMRLSFELKDSGTPALTTTKQLDFFIEDVNDEPPVFSPASYSVSIGDDSPIGLLAVLLKASDPDSAALTDLTFSLTPTGQFQVGAKTGRVTVAGRLDAASGTLIKLTASVTDGNFTTKANVSISLIDANNNDPQCGLPLFQFSISEALAADAEVGRVNATDRDTGAGAVLNFSLPAAASSVPFNLTQDGVLSLSTAVDRERTPQFDFSVQVSDNGVSPRRTFCPVRVTILDVNDNRPTFSSASYTAALVESSPANTPLTLVPNFVATDSDTGDNAKLKFELSGADASLFSVDIASGRIRLTGSLNRTAKPQLFFELSACDQNGISGCLKTSSNITVTVTVVSGRGPAFPGPYSFPLSEATKAGSSVGQVAAVDPDGTSGLRYFLSGDTGGAFVISPKTGAITLVRPLDRETTSSYLFSVTVEDPTGLSGNTSVTISVLDVNDNSPQFSPPGPVAVTLNDTTPGNTLVTSFRVSDRDTGANAALAAVSLDPPSVPFTIVQPSTGLVEVRTTAVLDRETTPSFRFDVLARDGGSPALQGRVSITLTVADVNDHPPVFEKSVYKGQVLAASPATTAVLVVKATDRDVGANAAITYGLEASAGSSFFAMDPSAGLLSVRATFTVDQLIAQNAIQKRNDSNATSTAEAYTPLGLTVLATDDGVPSKMTGKTKVELQIREAASGDPRFTETTYAASISENSVTGTAVTQVKATLPSDPSATFRYSLENDFGQFAIDRNTGNITTAGKLLDREATPTIFLEVKATTVGRSAERTTFTKAIVNVTVTDMNDNSPAFADSNLKFTVSENVSAPFILGQIVATDPDSGDNGRVAKIEITAGNTGNVFIIDASNRLVLNGSLDRETQAQYRLTIKASDAGTPPKTALASATISVSDVNDVTPRIVAPSGSELIVAAGPADRAVFSVTAADSDAGLAGRVLFSIQDSSQFYVISDGHLSGELRSFTALSAGSEFNLTLTARDLGSPELSSSRNLTVKVRTAPAPTTAPPVSPKSVPDFNQTSANFSIFDNVTVGQEVATYPAGTEHFTYSVVGGDSSYLTVGTGGKVSMLKRVSARLTPSLSLLIRAQNPLNASLQASLQLYIAVEASASTVLPEFLHLVVNLTWPEGVTVPAGGSLLIDLNTTDELSGIPVTYTIISGDTTHFRVDANNGKLYILKTVDREETSSYEIKVSALRNVRRRRRATPSNVITLRLTVGDVNDNPPKFTVTSPLAMSVPDSAGLGYSLRTVQATDADIGINGQITYSITRNAQLFAIGPSNGQVTLRSSLPVGTVIDCVVKATDGGGLSSQLTLKVQAIAMASTAVLTAPITAAAFERRRAPLMANISSILGLDTRLLKVQPHSTDAAGSVDVNKADAYLYAYYPGTTNLVPRAELISRLRAKNREIAALFGVDSIPIREPAQEQTIGVAEIILILIAAIIFVVAIIMIAILLISWRRCQREVKRSPVGSAELVLNGRPTNRRSGSEGVPNPSYMHDAPPPLNRRVSPVSSSSSRSANNRQPYRNNDSDGNPVVVTNSASPESQTALAAALATQQQNGGKQNHPVDLNESSTDLFGPNTMKKMAERERARADLASSPPPASSSSAPSSSPPPEPSSPTPTPEPSSPTPPPEPSSPTPPRSVWSAPRPPSADSDPEEVEEELDFEKSRRRGPAPSVPNYPFDSFHTAF